MLDDNFDKAKFNIARYFTCAEVWDQSCSGAMLNVGNEARVKLGFEEKNFIAP